MPPGNSAVEQRGEVRADVGEGGGEHGLDLVVDGLDHPAAARGGSCARPRAASSRNVWRSCSSVNSSSASGLIGPSRRSSRSSSRTRAGAVTPSGSGGQLGAPRRPPARRRGRGAASRPPPRGAAGPRPRRARPAGPARAPRRARARPSARRRRSVVEPGGDAADLVALAAAALGELGVVRRRSTCRWPSTSVGQAVERGERALDLRRAAARPRRARLGVGGEAALGLGEPLLEELLPLVQAGRCAPRDRGGAPASTRGPGVERGARPRWRARAASASAASSASSAGISASSSAIRSPLAVERARSARRCGAAAARARRRSRAARPGRAASASAAAVNAASLASSRAATARPRRRSAAASVGGGRDLGVARARAPAPASAACAVRLVERGRRWRRRRRRRGASPTAPKRSPPA